MSFAKTSSFFSFHLAETEIPLFAKELLPEGQRERLAQDRARTLDAWNVDDLWRLS